MASRTPQNRTISLRHLKVLIAEPMATTRRLVRATLEATGWSEIAEAGSGGQAFDAIERHGPHVIVLGHDLSDMGGTQIVRSMRGSTTHQHTPVVMLAERATHEDLLDAVDSGVDHFVLLPFDRDVFLAKMKLCQERAIALLRAQQAARAKAYQDRRYV